MKPKQRLVPSLTYRVNLVCRDWFNRVYRTCFYVGNDSPLSSSEIEEVVKIWQQKGIDRRSNRVIRFTSSLQT